MIYRLTLIILLSSYAFVFSQGLPVPYNLDFEIGEFGKLPKGWTVPSYADKLGYTAYLTNEEPKSGKYCLELFREGKYEEGMYGSVMQSVDAKPYRGKTIRLKAFIRAEVHSPKGSAHLWIRERIGNDEESGYFEYLPNQPCVLRKWELREIVGLISPDADVINFGLLLFGNGKAWIDSVSFEIILPKEGQKFVYDFDSRSIEQLVDLARVYGIVRYFSPLSEMDFNWECFLLNSVKFVLENTESISKKINHLFSDFLKRYEFREKDFDSTGYISWLHYGFPSEKQHPFIHSKKINIFNPLRKYQGIVQQVVNVQKYQKNKFTFSIYVSGRLLDFASKFVLAVRFDDSNNKQVGYYFEEFKNIDSLGWKKLELSATIPENSSFAKLALILVGEGNLFLDDAGFEVSGNPQTNLLLNNGFEMSKDTLLVFNWRLLDISSQSGYLAFVKKDKSRSGEKSLNLFSDPKTKISYPKPNEIVRIGLSDNGTIEVPISTPVSYFSNPGFNKSRYQELDCLFDLNDQISQIALLIDIWNFLIHFNLFFEPNESSELLLKRLIDETVRMKVQNQINLKENYFRILEKLISNIGDNFSRVIHREIINEKTFPFMWRYIDGKVLITQVVGTNTITDIGDEVLAINSIPTETYIDSISKFVGFSSERWKYLKSLAYIRNFLLSDTIYLRIKKPNGKIVNDTFTRSIFSNELVEERPDRFSFLNEKIVYFDLTRLTEKELKDILDTLSHKDYFIFDLRGIVLSSEQFLSLFTEKSLDCEIWRLPVFSFPNKQNISWQSIKCIISGKNLIRPKGIYFLIDERTIGIGEIIADIAKRYKIGILVGTTTGGNPMEMVSKTFPDGVTLYYGIFKVFTCGGEDLFKKGIPPNIPVKIKTDKENLSNDQVLKKVLSLIITK